MIGLSVEAKDAMLGLFAGRTLPVGLFFGGQEITDRRYERQMVQFSAPLGDDTRYVENVDYVRFPPMLRQHEIDSWAVFDEAGKQLAVYRLTTPRTLPAEDGSFSKPGALRIGIP